MKTIIKNAKVITMNEARTIHEHGYVVIEDGVFTAIEHGEPAEEAAKGANVVNADKNGSCQG